jgi:RimJ/RimL family protein N-acetyltransferase
MRENEDLQIRRLSPDDWADFRHIRLTALQTDPRVFSSTYAAAAARSEEEWRDYLAKEGIVVFGLYAADEMIGMTGVTVSAEDPAQGSLWGSFLRPAWRGRGLSGLFYKARIGWAREAGLSRLVVSHRAGNEASRRANRRHGFVHTHDTLRQWHDGAEEAESFYRLDL